MVFPFLSFFSSGKKHMIFFPTERNTCLPTLFKSCFRIFFPWFCFWCPGFCCRADTFFWLKDSVLFEREPTVLLLHGWRHFYQHFSNHLFFVGVFNISFVLGVSTVPLWLSRRSRHSSKVFSNPEIVVCFWLQHSSNHVFFWFFLIF